LVQKKKQQQFHLKPFITYQPGSRNTHNQVYNSKQKFGCNKIGKIFYNQVFISGNITVVEVCNSKIQKYIQYNGKIKQGEIKPIILSTHNILNATIDPQQPKRLHKGIKGNQKEQVGEEFPFQSSAFILYFTKVNIAPVYQNPFNLQ
jgi:hypothetical protein